MSEPSRAPSATMRAVAYSRHGGPEVLSLTEMPAPVPGRGELRIRTRATGLNPVDTMQREGASKALSPTRFPMVVGNELSGVIDAVGPGVHGFEVGQEVVTRVDMAEQGALAEQVVTRAEYVAAAPTGMSLVDAAGLPLAGLTAQQALGPEHLDVRAGDRLLVTGAAGGVGQFALQLATMLGAHVTATASPEGTPVVLRAGADEVIDYRERKVSEGPERFTKVLDLVGGDTLTDLFASVDRGGRVVSVAGPPTPGSLASMTAPSRRPLAAVVERASSFKLRRLARRAGATYEFFLMHPDGAGLAELVRLVDEGRLTVPIDGRYGIDDWRDAVARLESRRSKGKVVVEF